MIATMTAHHQTTTYWSAHWRWGALIIFVCALALRVLLIMAWHTPELDRFESGDYILYRIGADHIQAERNLSNSLFLVRPPVFPLMIAVFDLSDETVLIVNAVLGALIAALTVPGARVFGLSLDAALLAGLIVAVDPSSIVYTSFLGPEPLANLLLLAAVLALLFAVTHQEPGRRALAWGGLAGIAFGLSALTRPAAYLLWIVLGLWLLIVYRRHWATIGLFALVNLLIVGGWMLHNRAIFDHFTFSTISPYTMVYYHAASVEHLATGHDMDTVYTTINRRVEEHLGHDPTGITADARHGYLAASPEVARALNTVAWAIFRDHPLVTLVTFPIGFSRMYGIPSTLLGNHTVAMVVETLWNTALVVGTALGVWWAWRRRQWLLCWGVSLISAYYTAGTLLVKTAGLNARERSMLTPFLAYAVVYALMVLRSRIAARRSTPD